MAIARRISGTRRRLSVSCRVLAAVVGGYALTSLVNIAVPLLLSKIGFNRPEALLATTTASFLLYAAIAMAVFHARSATRAWAWLVAVSIPPAIVTFLLLPGAAP